ncbi:radical SAM protein [Enterococcus faecium]|nr:radical SAM protein [Enterococcus faecium]
MDNQIQVNQNDKFQLFKEDNVNILVERSSMRFYLIHDPNLLIKLKKHLNGTYVQEINEMLSNIETQKVDKYIDQKKNPSISKNFNVKRLALVLTSDCNLRCKYCYADCGIYSFANRTVMRNKSLENILEYFLTSFKSVEAIQFFGGEPSLCGKQIEFAVNYINKYCETHPDYKKPKYGIVTNGYALSNRLLDLFEENNFTLTLSLDGPASVNDAVRIDTKGKGSYNRIVESYRKAKDRKLENLGFEGTYTNEHLKQKVSLVDLVKFFGEEFGVNIPHIAPVQFDEPSSLDLYNDSILYQKYIIDLVDYTFECILHDQEIQTTVITLGIMRSIIENKFVDIICPAGAGTLSVAEDLVIQPCFMYTANESAKLGKIGDDPQNIVDSILQFTNAVNNKSKYTACEGCLAREICSSCLGTFDIEHQEKVVDMTCVTIITTLKRTLYQFARIQSDPLLWSKLAERLSLVS